MTTYFSSDHHLFHSKIIEFSRPQFKTLDEHNEFILDRHNSVVKDTDTCWFLGDVILSINEDYAFDFLKKFNGRKNLVLGNHDSAYRVRKYIDIFDKVVAYHTLQNRNGRESGFIISHIPVHPSELDERFTNCIHGHKHEYVIDDPRYINVCMEQINYTPISFDEIIERVKTK